MARYRSLRALLSLAVVLCGLWLMPGHAHGQIGLAGEPAPSTTSQAPRVFPPNIESTDPYRGLVMTIIVVVCAGAALGVAVIPSQRTHQD